MKIGDYAKETAKIYTTNYPWRNMSATFHKILYHGEDVIKYHLVPLGDLSEEAQEKGARITDFIESTILEKFYEIPQMKIYSIYYWQCQIRSSPVFEINRKWNIGI